MLSEAQSVRHIIFRLIQESNGGKLGCSTAMIRRCETGERDINRSMCESCSVDKRVFDDPDHIEGYCNFVLEVLDYSSIGERVRELRKEKGLIQKEKRVRPISTKK